jgi:hypothetical protein
MLERQAVEVDAFVANSPKHERIIGIGAVGEADRFGAHRRRVYPVREKRATVGN